MTAQVDRRWVIAPAVLTLAITLLRLVGELNGWDPAWFGTGAGGDGALLGISWLMPVMGIYFAARLARVGNGPPHRGKALLWALLGLGLFMVPMAALASMLDGDEPSMGFVYGFLLVGAISWLGVFAARRGWPELGRLLLDYALAARIPIIVLTFVLVPLGTGTHFEKPAPVVPDDLPWFVLAAFLAYAQATVWIAMTVGFGALFGGLAALVLRPAATR